MLINNDQDGNKVKAEWYGDTAGNLSTAIKQPVNKTA